MAELRDEVMIEATGLAARWLADRHGLEYDDAVRYARTAIAASHGILTEAATRQMSADAEAAISAESSAAGAREQRITDLENALHAFAAGHDLLRDES